MQRLWTILSVLSVSIALVAIAPRSAPAQSSDEPLTAQTFIDVARKVLPTVVSIDVRVRPSERLRRELRDNDEENPFGVWRRMRPEDFGSRGSGSGVIVRIEDGWAYVLTNRHVLEESPRAEYSVTLDGNYLPEEYRIEPKNVEVVGFDELSDIAVIRFRMPEGAEIEPAEFADSERVQVGEWVLALGNPLDRHNSVSQGIVSAKNRDVPSNQIAQLLQTTAVINPGNSGGPLVNLDGRIIGINNAIATTTGQWAGIGFAIPGNAARRVSDLLIRDGAISRGFLGITMMEARDGAGVAVVDVTPSTPAQAAGVSVGDVVYEVDGRPVVTSKELLAEIGNRFAGDEVRLAIRRTENDEEKIMDVVVTLVERPAENVLGDRNKLLEWLGGDASAESLEELTRLGISAESDSEGRSSGMRVTRVEPASPAARAGLRKDDLLVTINGIDTVSQMTLLESLRNVETGKEHVILFRRAGSNQFVTIDQ